MSPARQPMSSGDIGGGGGGVGLDSSGVRATGPRRDGSSGSGTTISERQLALPPPLTEGGGGGLLPGARRQGAGAGCLDL